ncbi:hypothetical protein V8F20_000577 [Naviculisporaceae sp. PSN 640]
MSVDMEQAEPYGDIAQFDQEGYNLDLDAGVDTNDLDLQLETFETEVEYQTSATDPATSFSKPTGDIDVGFDVGFDEENMVVDHHDHDQDESTHHQETEADHDASNVDAKNVEVEYGDEIGYDEDDDDGDDAAAGTATEPDVSAPQTAMEEPKLDNEPLEAPNYDENAVGQYHDSASLHNEHAGQGDENDVAALNGNMADAHDSDLAAALTSQKQEQSVSSITELEHIEKVSGDSPETPYVEVHYKETRYSLFGSPEDDPDSYFLSEPKHLDIPLYEFLIAIRQVVEDELSSHDELSIRIPSLALEFGERSRESFLRAHSFREIHDCWTRLFFDEAEESSYLVLHLVVCPDPEHRFAELLTQAELPHASAPLEDSGEYSEKQGATSFEEKDGDEAEEQHGDGAEDQTMGFDDAEREGDGAEDHADTNTGDFGEDFHNEEKDGDDAEDHTDAHTGNFEDNFEDESAAVSKPDSGQLVAQGQEDAPEEDHKEHGASLEFPSFQVNSLRFLPDTDYERFDLGIPKEVPYFDEYEMVDRDEDAPEEGDAIEGQEFPEAGNDDDESPEGDENYEGDGNYEEDENFEGDENYEGNDIVADVEVTATGETEVSVIGAGVETTTEFYEINIDLGEDPSLAAHETGADLKSLEDTAQENGHLDDDSAGPTDQQDSSHTSATSTVHGDEIDYEDHTVEDESFAMDPETTQQPNVDAEEEDEIDWRNDGDEEEAALLPTAESPSSTSAKRTRTDDADVLVDEADHKRRRT